MNKHNTGKAFEGAPDKDTYLTKIRQEVIKRTGQTFAQLRKLPHEALFVLALQHVTCTKKSLCLAFNLTLESMCRRKRELERAGRLWIVRKGRCPITGEKGVQFLTTNEKLKPFNPQINLFGEGGPVL